MLLLHTVKKVINLDFVFIYEIYYKQCIKYIIIIAGVAMVPVSWTEMQCPKTLTKELRKVAKIVPEEVAILD